MQSARAETPLPISSSRVDQNLVSLATPVLDIILRVKAGVLTPSKDLRITIDRQLKQMEQHRESLGIKEWQMQAVKFGLSAFVDEIVLTADFPLRHEWEKYPLQLEYFGEHLAGVTFFERLEGLLRDVQKNVDVIELYYVCLLLGYKGKYKLYYEDQLKAVTKNVADHLRRANRLRSAALSPHWRVDDQPDPPAKPKLPAWFTIGGSAMVASVVIVYLFLYFFLDRILMSAKEQLLR